jgi:hypothetical protein
MKPLTLCRSVRSMVQLIVRKLLTVSVIIAFTTTIIISVATMSKS